MVEKSCCGNSGQMVIYQTDNKMFYFLFCCQGTEEQTSILPSIIKPLVYGQTVLCVTGLRSLNICYLQVLSLDNATYLNMFPLLLLLSSLVPLLLPACFSNPFITLA